MSTHKRTILCIDDEAVPLEVRSELLKKAGYHVIVAGSGKDGIRLFASEKIDLVVLDYWMDRINGLDVAEKLKSMNRKVPILMLSGYGSILDEGIGKVDRWLIKGESDPEELIAAISELLSQGC